MTEKGPGGHQGIRLAVTAAILVFAVSACGSPAATPTLTPTQVSPAATSLPMSSGQQLFISKGCAACHGQNAEGSPIAPALPGHTEEQVKRQVRNPVGTMPRFAPEQISEEELEQIADYIQSLALEQGHIEPTGLPMPSFRPFAASRTAGRAVACTTSSGS